MPKLQRVDSDTLDSLSEMSDHDADDILEVHGISHVTKRPIHELLKNLFCRVDVVSVASYFDPSLFNDEQLLTFVNEFLRWQMKFCGKVLIERIQHSGSVESLLL